MVWCFSTSCLNYQFKYISATIDPGQWGCWNTSTLPMDATPQSNQYQYLLSWSPSQKLWSPAMVPQLKGISLAVMNIAHPWKSLRDNRHISERCLLDVSCAKPVTLHVLNPSTFATVSAFTLHGAPCCTSWSTGREYLSPAEVLWSFPPDILCYQVV